MKQLRMAVGEIDKGRAQPVYLICGEEAFLVRRSRDRLIESLRGDDVGFTSFEGDVDVQEVLSELSSLSLFSSARLVLWAHCPLFRRDSNQNARKTLYENVESVVGNESRLVLTAEKVDANGKLYRRIKALGEVIRYPALSPYNLGEPRRDEAFPYVESYLEEQGKTIHPDAFRELRTRMPAELWSVMSELDRLVAFAGNRDVIELADVETLTPFSRDDVAFELLDAVGSRKLDDALRLLARLQQTGTAPLQIVRLLSKSLLQVREARTRLDGHPSFETRRGYRAFQSEVLPALKRIDPKSILVSQHPYAAYKAFQRAERFHPGEIERLIRGLAQIDLKLKTSNVDGIQALQLLLILRLARKATGRGNPR